MLGFIYRMIVGSFTSCKHQWQHKDGLKVVDNEEVFAIIYIQSCKHCGKISQTKVCN
jgi:hypothetical protein